MSGENTRIHGPSDTRPAVTQLVAHCTVCGAQWQVWGTKNEKGCSFCDAPESAIRVQSEKGSNKGVYVRPWEYGR